MAKKDKNKEQDFIGGYLISGLPRKNNESIFLLKFMDDQLKITEKLIKAFKKDEELQVFWLDMDQIISIDLLTEDNIVEKQKSVVGRGVAGAVLFGTVGAIIGSASGAKTEQSIEKKGVLVVSYYGKNTEEPKTIEIEVIPGGVSYARNFEIYYHQHYTLDTFEKNEDGDIIL